MCICVPLCVCTRMATKELGDAGEAQGFAAVLESEVSVVLVSLFRFEVVVACAYFVCPVFVTFALS